MAKGFINDSTLTAIANAIRAKNGATAKMKPSAMAAAIAALSGTPEGLSEVLVTDFTLSSDNYMVTIPSDITTEPDWAIVVADSTYPYSSSGGYYYAFVIWVNIGGTRRMTGTYYYSNTSTWESDVESSYRVSVVDTGLRIMVPSGRPFKSGYKYNVVMGWWA